MRPIKLRFRAFGPYAEEQELDFDTLGENRVFLICGPTGAGKTSILDAMCFALYGETSGGERDPRRMRSDHAPVEVPTEVSFEFALGDEHFCVWRTPEQERAKKRGEGTTVAPGEAVLWRRDGVGAEGEGTVLAHTARAVTETVVRLLGFECAQFRQVIVLPQGQFRRLLTASSREREKILEALFQTETYRRIEEQLKANAKTELAGLRDLARRREIVLEQADVEDSGRLAEALAQIEGELRHEVAELQKLSHVEADIQKRLEEARSVQRRLQERRDADSELRSLQRRRQEMGDKHVELERGRRAAGVVDVASAAAARGREKAEADRAAADAGRARDAAIERRATAWAALVQSEAGAPEREVAREALARLETSRDRVAELTAAKNELDLRAGLRDEWAEKAKRAAAELQDCRRQRELAMTQELERARAALRELEDSHRAAVAARLADELQDGAACPVCGSEDHPAPAHRDEVPSLTDAAGGAEQADQAAARVQGVERRIAELAAREQRADTGHREAEDGLRRARERWAEQSGRVEQVERELPEDVREAGALDRAIRTARSSWERAVKAHETIVQKAQQADRDVATTEESVRSAEQVAATARERAEAAVAAFEVRLTECGFAGAAEFEGAQRSPEMLEQLAQDLRDFEAELNAAEQRLRRAERDTEGLDEPDLEPIETELAELRTKVHELRKRHGAHEERARQMKAWLTDLERVETRIAAAEDSYAVIGRLAEVAGGQNAQGLTFQRFVLAALLEDVLLEATRRLRLMSHGRFELRRARERRNLRAAGGLDLEVYDAHTSTLRPVNSLSGGESFLASLSLALGLSDVVQSYSGGIRLETVFIDEGFGSLDAEAVDLAFRTLVDLHGEGRLIGVISHVAELEERVSARLVVERGRSGSVARFV